MNNDKIMQSVIKQLELISNDRKLKSVKVVCKYQGREQPYEFLVKRKFF